MTHDAKNFVHHRGTEDTELLLSAGRVVSLQQLRQQQELQTALPSKRLDGHAESVNDVNPAYVQKVRDGQGSFESLRASATATSEETYSSNSCRLRQPHGAHSTANANDVSESNNSEPSNSNQTSLLVLRDLRGNSVFAVLCASVVNQLQTGAAQ